MRVNSLNIRNIVQVKHHYPMLGTSEDWIETYEDFLVSSVASKNEGNRVFLIGFEQLEVNITIEEMYPGSKDASIIVRYTNQCGPTIEIFKDDCFVYDYENEIYFPKTEVITAINNQLKKDYDFVVFPDIDYNSICNF